MVPGVIERRSHMKKIFIIILVAIACSSCSFDVEGKAQEQLDEYRDEQLEKKFTGHTLYYGDFSEIDSIDDIPDYMDRYVDYLKTINAQDPEYTLFIGTGDCDCFALLYQNILFVRFGIKSDLGIVKNTDRHVVEGGRTNHAVIILEEGTPIHAQSGALFTGAIGYMFTFDEVFSR